MDLRETYRESMTEELRAIASSNRYMPAAQEIARQILRERGVEPPPPPPEDPDEAPRPAAAAGGRKARPILLIAVLLVGAINLYLRFHRSDPDPRAVSQVEEIQEEARRVRAETAAGGGSLPAAAAPRASVAPIHEVAWKPRTGPLDKREKVLVGTWIARVGDGATRSAFMANNVLFRTDGASTGHLAAAILKNDRLKTNCIWLELYETRHGLRRECAIVNDDPSTMSKEDPVTGKKTDLGTTFDWAWDEKAAVVRLHFDEDMLMPVRDGKAPLRFRTWVWGFGGMTVDGLKAKITVEESIPEHDFVRQEADVYEVSPGRFVGGADVPSQ